MKIRLGYELVYECPQPTFMILMLNVHYSRFAHLVEPDHSLTSPQVPIAGYRDSFGNWCTRIVAPAGQITIRSDAVVRDSGEPDRVMPHARQTPVEQLPDDALLFLLASRYCETDRLMDTAWSLFGTRPRAGPASRRSSTMCTSASPSAISMRARPRPRSTRTRSGAACAATSPISPSRFAAA